MPVQHVHAVTASPEHIDMFGHVNNAWYIAWAMECAWGHSNALGLDFSVYEQIGIGCVVREHKFIYLAPALEGDEIVIATAILANDGRLRLRRGFEQRRQRDGTVLVRGETEFVTISMVSGRPARMPAQYARLYAPASSSAGPVTGPDICRVSGDDR